MGLIGSRFSRVEPRRRARAFALGLLAELPRKNCWTIAERCGDATPDGMQHQENFQASKGLTGLDEQQVRRWASWYRWATLATLASSFLTLTAAAEHARTPDPAGQIPLTRNEIAHLFASLTIPRRRHRPPDALVILAAPPPATRPGTPLPAQTAHDP